MNNKITDVEAYNKLNNVKNDEDKKDKNDKKDDYKKNDNINMSNNNNEYKDKYENLVKKEIQLNERIKYLEDSGNKKEDAKNAALKDNEALTKKLQEVAKNWMTSKSLLEDFKNFIKQNVKEEKAKDFYKSLQMSEDL